MKRKLLAMLLCTVILFNNALPVLAEMDPVEGNTTETTTTAPEVTEPITPVVCNDCGQEKCVCEDETDTTAAENTSESTATSEDVTTSESTSEEPSSSAAEETDEPCADCTDEAKCEKHAAEIIVCEVCNTTPCVCPVTETCPDCGVELVEGEEHACETTTCADCNETYITAVGHECPVVKCSTCNAVIEGEDHVCEEHICEVCQATYYGETHECEMCECGKLLGHEDACQICLCGAIDENTHHEDCMNMIPQSSLTEEQQELYDALLATESVEAYYMVLEMAEELMDVEAFNTALSAVEIAELDGHLEMLRDEAVYHSYTDVAPFFEAVEVEPVGKERFIPEVAMFSTRATTFAAAMPANEVAETVEDTSTPVKVDGLDTSKTVTDNRNGTYTIQLEAFTTGTIKSEAVTTVRPCDIVLVLDYSSSMEESFGRITRLEALVTAVNNFIDSVSGQYTAESNHRMSIVKFDREGDLHNDWTFVTGNTNISTLKVSTSELADGSGTNPGDGMAEAVAQFANNKYLTGGITADNASQRQKVVVMFTDGLPSDINYASTAINHANSLKNAGATVYSVAILNGANPATTITQWTGFSGYGGYENALLHTVSSNYPNATANIRTERWNTYLDITPGTGGNNGYYLTANDPDDLNNIFQEISNNIQSGSSTIDLGTSTVIKDIVTPYFAIPDNASAVKVYAVDCLSYYDDNPSAATWETLAQAEELNDAVTIDAATKTIEVTGFNFTHNFVAETGRVEGDASQAGNFHGRKLVIVFDITPEEGFLGGNHVPTNGSTSGIYKDGVIVENFDVPYTDVLIPDVNVNITVDAGNKHVYYNGDITDEQLMEGTSASATITTATGVQIHIVDLKSSLADWQKEFVNITFVLTDATGNVINTGLEDLKADTTYTLTATITPKTSGDSTGLEATTKSGDDIGYIYVYTPEVTFKDGYVYFGGAMPTDYSSLLTNTTWKHGTTDHGDVAMIGTAPALTFTYSSDKTVVDTKDNIPVNVVNANGIPTTFVWDDCNTGETKSADAEFQLHVHVPTLEVEDGNVYYAGNMPTAEQYNAQQAATGTWGTLPGEMLNDAPTLTYSYDKTTGVVNTVDDISVNATLLAGGQTVESKEFKLHVYTPEFTFTDSSAYYGDVAPTEFTAPEVNWNNDDVTMWNAAPTFAMTFANENGAVKDGYVVTPYDYKVNVDSLKVGAEDYINDANITFKWLRDGCDSADIAPHAASADSHEFYVHVNTCSLTIKKTGFDSLDPNEVAMFNVTGDNEHVSVNLDVAVHNDDEVTINGLPVGTYTVDEDENWSWRYEKLDKETATVSATVPNAEVAFTNNRAYDLWLDFAAWCKNVFKPGNTATGIIKQN